MRIDFLSRGPMNQISGGYLYNRYLIEHLRAEGLDVTYHTGLREWRTTGGGDVVIVDGLALPESLTDLLDARAEVVLLLHVVPDPRDFASNGSRGLMELCRRSRVVVTGDTSLAAIRERLAIPGLRVAKIEPGVPAHWKVKERYSDRAHRLVGVANYLPGKGVGRMIDVLVEARDLPWCLTVWGNASFDPGHHGSMVERVRRSGLTGRIDLRDSVPHDQVNAEMLAADLLLHFSGHESYSMATAEAVACGLPVLSYATGNADMFLRSGLVRHVVPGQEADAVRTLIEEPGAYASLRRAGPRSVRTWQNVGDEFVAWLGGWS